MDRRRKVKVTQGQSSFLPDLNDAEIKLQIDYGLNNGWALAIEYTDDPHPRNCYWSMWGNPIFDLRDPAGVMMELDAGRREHPGKDIKILAFDNKKGWESVRLSYIVQPPDFEPGFELIGQETEGRQIRYSLRSHSMARMPDREAV